MDTNNHNEFDRPNGGDNETRQAALITPGNRDRNQRGFKGSAAVGKPPRSDNPEPAVKSAASVGKASSCVARLRSGPSLYERLLAEEISIRESFARR